MNPPEFPIALGVIRSAFAPTYDDMMIEQISEQRRVNKIKCMDDLLNSGDTWEM
jgi:2-oxoglutarate ferredoxin oxidoreductase subunit beta